MSLFISGPKHHESTSLFFAMMATEHIAVASWHNAGSHAHLTAHHGDTASRYSSTRFSGSPAAFTSA